MMDRNKRPTALYRIFTEDGRLLYVGISLSPTKRIGQHNRDKDWFPEAQKVEIEWYPDRRTASKAEGKAIATERPFYNESRPSGSLNPYEPPEEDGWWITARPVSNTRCEYCEKSYGPRRFRMRWADGCLMTKWVCANCRTTHHLAPSHPEFVNHVGRSGGGWVRYGREA